MADEKRIEITPELMDAFRAAGSAEEIVEIARENGVEASVEEAKAAYAALHSAGDAIADEELGDVAGGGCGGGRRQNTCPSCGEADPVIIDQRTMMDAGGTYAIVTYQCRQCRHTWKGEVLISGYY